MWSGHHGMGYGAAKKDNEDGDEGDDDGGYNIIESLK